MTKNNNYRIGLFDQELKQKDFSKIRAWKYIKYLEHWIKDKVKTAKAKGIVIGISGGIDSALMLAIGIKCFPKNVKAITMPINNLSNLNYVSLISSSLNIEIEKIDLSTEFQQFSTKLAITSDLAKVNLMPRLRMMTLYAKAQDLNYLVCGTDNYDEIYTGYFTKYGDGGVDILPLSKLLKSEVRYLARLLKIPDLIIDQSPSANLWNGQTDEKEMKISYNKLDLFLSNNTVNLTQNELDRINYLNQSSQHKRDAIYQPKTIQQVLESEGE